MRLLYSAIDQQVPGTRGGSVHVAAVAEGLAALGYDVHALVTPGAGRPASTAVRWIALPAPLGSPHLRLLRSRTIARLVRDLLPDVIMERYHNFGGEAIHAARPVGALAVLEVNAPVVDFPGSAKATIDRALLAEPMRRWRERLCRLADLIITPHAGILPPATPPARVVQVEWGADTDRFRPDVREPAPFERPDVQMLAVFAGAFRRWHGAIHLVRAVSHLHASGRRDVGAVMIGDGPELPAVREAARGQAGIVFTGALPHALVPAALAHADVGVAPFDLAAHRPLSLGFYWSPLKIFEYMASGLPVLAPRADRLPALVADDREGILYDPAKPDALADALLRACDPALRARLGQAARARAVREYSWTAHCQALDAAFQRARAAGRR